MDAPQQRETILDSISVVDKSAIQTQKKTFETGKQKKIPRHSL
jgi:hypothetical protein